MQRWASVVVVLVVSGCQPEAPGGSSRQSLTVTAVPQNVVFLVDASGSMQQPLDPQQPECAGCQPGTTCAPSCVTRWSVVQALVESVGSRLAPGSQVALSTYPTDATCGAPPAPAFSPTLDLGGLARVLLGGTPTALALRMAQGLPQLHDPGADNVVVLITDGLPNCNREHPGNLCGGGDGTCRCTARSCDSPSVCATGCLDDDGTLAAAQALGTDGVQLITVTVGTEWTRSTARSLANQLAQVQVEQTRCGPNCQALVMQLERAADRATTEARVSERLAGCTLALAEPAGPTLDVELEGEPLSPESFVVSGSRLWLGSSACERYRGGAQLTAFHP